MKQSLTVLLLVMLVCTSAGCLMIPNGADKKSPADGDGVIVDNIVQDDPVSPLEQPTPVVAYVNNGNLWLANGYNAPHPLTNSGEHRQPFQSCGNQGCYRQQPERAAKKQPEPLAYPWNHA